MAGVKCSAGTLLFGLSLLPVCGLAQTPDQVLVVVNNDSTLSRRIGEYYAKVRLIPPTNICHIKVAAKEGVTRQDYDNEIEGPIRHCLQNKELTERVLYIVTTMGVPLKIAGSGSPQKTSGASVDSELCLLYARMKGQQFTLSGPVPNPFFQQTEKPFGHPAFPIYLVTRLAGYNFEDVKGLIDRAQQARNRGKVVLDLEDNDDARGNNWLRKAAEQLPANRVILDTSRNVIYDQRDVIAYASWGSNDKNRNRRWSGFKYLPGAIMTEYVSTNGRTFERPPESFVPSANWKDESKFFATSPQSLTADAIAEGVTGASGHVDEPYLTMTPRPEFLIPAYLKGRTLAESYYMSIAGLSWQNIVIGDPLCRLRP